MSDTQCEWCGKTIAPRVVHSRRDCTDYLKETIAYVTGHHEKARARVAELRAKLAALVEAGKPVRQAARMSTELYTVRLALKAYDKAVEEAK